MEVDEDNQRPKLALELNFLRDRLRFQSVRFSIFVFTWHSMFAWMINDRMYRDTYLSSIRLYRVTNCYYICKFYRFLLSDDLIPDQLYVYYFFPQYFLSSINCKNYWNLLLLFFYNYWNFPSNNLPVNIRPAGFSTKDWRIYLSQHIVVAVRANQGQF